MDDKERLRLAKEALDSGSYDKETIEYIFPELKEESEDERIVKELLTFFRESIHGGHILTNKEYDSWIAWLEKQGEQLQGKSALEAANEVKVDNANKVEPRQEELTKFEKAVKQVMEEAIECGDTHNLKADADMLLRLSQKPVWSEEDKGMLLEVKCLIDTLRSDGNSDYSVEELKKMWDWLDTIWQRIEYPQIQWKPSDEQLEAVKRASNGSRAIYGNDYLIMESLYQDLKKLSEE